MHKKLSPINRLSRNARYINYLKEGLHPSISHMCLVDSSQKNRKICHMNPAYSDHSAPGMKTYSFGRILTKPNLSFPIIWSRWKAGFSTFREWYMMCGRHKETLAPPLLSCHVLVTPSFCDRFTRGEIPTWSAK